MKSLILLGGMLALGVPGFATAQTPDAQPQASEAVGTSEEGEGVVIDLAFVEEDEPAAPPAPIAMEKSEAQSRTTYLFLEPKLGWMIPSTRLEAAPSYGVQAGLQLFPENRIWLLAELDYAHSSAQGNVLPFSGTDLVAYRIRTNDLSLWLGGRKMFETPWAKQLPTLEGFVDAGVKLHWLNSSLDGSGAASGSIGESSESNFALGVAARVGALYWVGPGAATLSLEFGYSRFSQDTTGGANVFSFLPALGYLVAF